MLFNYLYLINNFDPVLFDNAQKDEAFIVPVNTNITGKRPDVFQTLFRSAGSFCFSVSDNIAAADKHFIQTEIIQQFIRLLFLPNYLRIDGRQVCFINPLNGNHNASLAVAERLREAVLKQGIDLLVIEPQYITADSWDTGSEYAVCDDNLNNFLSAEDNQANFISFTKTFSLPLDVDKKWLIRITSKSDLETKKRKLDKLEVWLRGTQSFKVQLMKKLGAAIAEKRILKQENKLLAFKLENSSHYLKLIREESMRLVNENNWLRADIQRGTRLQHDDAAPGSDYELIAHYQKALLEERQRADETFNWYQKEYEVLPLWFKRLGQLIRVVMGKRSFASLFNKSNHDTGTKSIE